MNNCLFAVVQFKEALRYGPTIGNKELLIKTLQEVKKQNLNIQKKKRKR